ncbi:MAG TPA: hypothetical protein ENJ89_03180 [Caldithrix abyssi]|uniref:Uncharacterized protein n=1 Tax=Caldithrix abyssi TaxID=187145 RepID=A0A7V5PNH4_CALAY|nr:hypothetical protein [Caldithrix abyssi]
MVRFFRNLTQTSRRSFYRDRFYNWNNTIRTWREIQSRALKICGRGGKGHLRATGERHWNRKGRWE